MDMTAEIHSPVFARIAYRAMEQRFFGESRVRALANYAEAVTAGKILAGEQLFDAEAISLECWVGVLEVGLASWGEEFPLLLMERAGMDCLGVAGCYLTSARTMRDVITGFSLHYPAIDTSLDIELRNAPGGLYFDLSYRYMRGWLGACFNGPAISLFEQMLVAVAELQANDKCSLKIYAARPASGQLYEDAMLIKDVTWEPRADNKFGFSAFITNEVLDRRNTTYEPGMHEMLERIMWDRTNANSRRADAATNYSSDIRMRLAGAMRIPDLEKIAADHGTSPRTLQQRLQEEGTTFQSLVDNEMINRAKGVLSAGGSAEDAADRLGMNASNFRRKFKSVTGQSPTDWKTSQPPSAQAAMLAWVKR